MNYSPGQIREGIGVTETKGRTDSWTEGHQRILNEEP